MEPHLRGEAQAQGLHVLVQPLVDAGVVLVAVAALGNAHQRLHDVEPLLCVGGPLVD